MISAVAQKYNIHPQTLRLYEREGLLKPSRTEGNTRLYSEEDLKGLSSDLVSPGVVALAAEGAPTRVVLLAGAGAFEQAHITMTQGVYVGDAPDAAEQIQAQWARISDRSDEAVPASGAAQYLHEVQHPGRAAPQRQAVNG